MLLNIDPEHRTGGPRPGPVGLQERGTWGEKSTYKPTFFRGVSGSSSSRDATGGLIESGAAERSHPNG